MRTVKIKELSLEAFRPFGTYANHVNPDADKIGSAPIEFFRDMVQVTLGNTPNASFSTCRVEKRDRVIDVTECHSVTGEVLLPLDNDVLIHVGPATPPDAGVPLEEIEVLRVPKGTLVSLRPGVWHHAPFAVENEAANVLVVLPERTYANDCIVVELDPADRIEIADA